MASKKKPGGGLGSVTFRPPESVIAAFDEWVDEMNKGRDWPQITRSDVLRNLMAWAARTKPDIEKP
jgi:hypothetical protein